MAKHYPFGQQTLQRLQAMPGPGGTHAWLARVAGGLRQVFEPDRCFKVLRQCCDQLVAHRHIPDREIRAAIEFSYQTTLEPAKPAYRWPAPDPTLIAECLAFNPPRFNPNANPGLQSADVLPALFHPGELVCAGPNQETALVRPLEQTLHDAHWHQFIVPNPMRATVGLNQKGLPSPRCQSNVATRRHLVTEFDNPNLSKTDQASLISRLAVYHPLTLVVDSGGKSLHAWFHVQHLPRHALDRCFAYACLLGADPSRWDICGWVRMPGGLRQSKATPITTTTQRILFFAPNALPSSKGSPRIDPNPPGGIK